jgi:NodT family efflux transporter outer membrane factor (OMF) lipoprotein
MITMPILRRLLLAGVTALAAGCASDGGWRTQAHLQDADRLASGATLAQAQLSAAAWPARDWWRRYSDPQLDALVEEALAASPGMRAAEARVRQAAAAAASAGAALAPQVNAAARSNRVEFSENSNVPKPLAGSWKWSNEASLNVAYELDFWGKNQAVLDAALGRVKAAEVDTEAARLLLTVTLAQSYLRLSQLYAQRDLGEQVLQQRRHILALSAQRAASQIDSQADLKQAELAIPLAQADLAAVDEAIALVRAQLAALLGSGPDRGAAIARPQLRLARPAALPSMLPSALLARRPEVVAQRWRVESLRSDIDVAKAQFYPSINLNGLVGLQSLGFSHLLQGGSAIASAGAGFSLPIFDGGRLRANLASRNADYDVAVEAYNQTLIDALRDVVSQLVSIEWLEQRGKLQTQALLTAQQAYALSEQRYRAGLGNYLQVLAAQLQVLQQQRAQIDLDTRAFDLDMQLARALGGGYSDVSSLSGEHHDPH